MKIIKTKPYCLIFFSWYLMSNYSCTKSPSSTFQRIDTVKYEAIIDYGTRDWCVTGTYPVSIGTDTTIIPWNVFGECNETQNVEATFTIKKYTNNYIYLGIKAYNQWPNASPTYPDSAVTINIFLNNILVATQTAKTKDSLRYIIY